MTVIAMTREMGTLGKDVAAGVAERLGIEVVHHELVERQLAEQLEMTESAVHRFLEGEASMWERWKIDSKKLSRFTAVDLLELATREIPNLGVTGSNPVGCAILFCPTRPHITPDWRRPAP